MVKQEKDSASVLWGCLLHGGKTFSESFHELPLFNTDNTSERHLPRKRYSLPSAFTLLPFVLGWALCCFSGSWKDRLPEQVELMPWSLFFFFFYFVKYKNGFELLRNNNLKPIAQRKHAWLLLNTRRNPYSKDYAAGWRLKLTWWSIWINFKPSAWRVLSQNGWDKYLAEYLIWIFPSPSSVGMQASL